MNRRPDARATVFGRLLASLLALVVMTGCAADAPHPAPDAAARTGAEPAWTPLFPTNGVPGGWVVRGWTDVGQPAPPEAKWEVVEGVLQGSRPRGTWLASELEYSNFVVELEFRLGERGQSGVAVRFPMQGDPSVEGLEIQLVDPRYYGTNTPPPPWHLTGAIYQAVAPSAQVFRPADWNSLRISCLGPNLEVTVNGQKVVQVNLDNQIAPLERGKPLAERPRRGHLAFQEVSRGTGVVEIRNARIQVRD